MSREAEEDWGGAYEKWAGTYGMADAGTDRLRERGTAAVCEEVRVAWRPLFFTLRVPAAVTASFTASKGSKEHVKTEIHDIYNVMICIM